MEPVTEPTDAALLASARRIRAYLRCAGITDEHALARATEALIASSSEASPAELSTQALERAIAAQQRCLEMIAACCGPEQATGPLLAWHVRSMAQIDPDGVFAAEGPSPEVLTRLSAADTRATPDEQWAAMPTQPLGALPKFLRRGFWRTLLRRANAAEASAQG